MPIIFLLVLLLTGAALAQRVATIEDPDGYSNVRDGPGTDHYIIGKVKAGERLVVYPDKSQWWRVILPTQEFVNRNASGGRGVSANGFIAASRIKISNQVAYSLAAVHDPDGYSNLRAGPGTGHPVLRRVSDQELVISLEAVLREGWVEVITRDGHRGFLHSSRLSPLEFHLPSR